MTSFAAKGTRATSPSIKQELFMAISLIYFRFRADFGHCSERSPERADSIDFHFHYITGLQKLRGSAGRKGASGISETAAEKLKVKQTATIPKTPHGAPPVSIERHSIIS